MSGTIAETEKCKIPHIMKLELDLYVMSLTTFPNNDFKVIMLRCFYVIVQKPLLDERTVKLNAPSPKGGDIIRTKNMLKCN